MILPSIQSVYLSLHKQPSKQAFSNWFVQKVRAIRNVKEEQQLSYSLPLEIFPMIRRAKRNNSLC